MPGKGAPPTQLRVAAGVTRCAAGSGAGPAPHRTEVGTPPERVHLHVHRDGRLMALDAHVYARASAWRMMRGTRATRQVPSIRVRAELGRTDLDRLLCAHA